MEIKKKKVWENSTFLRKAKREIEKFQKSKLHQFVACDAMLSYIERQLLKYLKSSFWENRNNWFISYKSAQLRASIDQRDILCPGEVIAKLLLQICSRGCLSDYMINFPLDAGYEMGTLVSSW